jgi:hypothetical protein
MIIEGLISNIIYPDEQLLDFDSREKYDLVIKELKACSLKASGENKVNFQDTLTELEKRWLDRQILNKASEIIELSKNKNTLEQITEKFDNPIDIFRQALEVMGMADALY